MPSSVGILGILVSAVATPAAAFLPTVLSPTRRRTSLFVNGLYEPPAALPFDTIVGKSLPAVTALLSACSGIDRGSKVGNC